MWAITWSMRAVDISSWISGIGRGRPHGRSFRVKLWPTLVFLKDGQEVARVTRPASLDEVRDAFVKLG